MGCVDKSYPQLSIKKIFLCIIVLIYEIDALAVGFNYQSFDNSKSWSDYVGDSNFTFILETVDGLQKKMIFEKGPVKVIINTQEKKSQMLTIVKANDNFLYTYWYQEGNRWLSYKNEVRSYEVLYRISEINATDLKLNSENSEILNILGEIDEEIITECTKKEICTNQSSLSNIIEQCHQILNSISPIRAANKSCIENKLQEKKKKLLSFLLDSSCSQELKSDDLKIFEDSIYDLLSMNSEKIESMQKKPPLVCTERGTRRNPLNENFQILRGQAKLIKDATQKIERIGNSKLFFSKLNIYKTPIIDDSFIFLHRIFDISRLF